MPKSRKPWLRPVLLTPLLIATLTACAAQTPTPGTEAVAPAKPEPATGCAAFARITFDRLKDTDETIRQVKAYDAARDAICGVGK